MQDFNSLTERIKTIKKDHFNELAIDVFNYQYQNNVIYAEWCNTLSKNPQNVLHLNAIPFLPIEFFKSFEIKSGRWQADVVFESSGTTGSIPSRHFIAEESFYLSNCVQAFEIQYGPLHDFVILALLPSYLERGNSGLISMVNHFIQKTSSVESGFYLNEYQKLYDQLMKLKHQNKKVLLWGVTFGLLDFAEQFQFHFPELLVMETGGMKGRREEMVRSEVHQILQKAFGVSSIHSEYGMTELSSQAYSKSDGIFFPSSTMKVLGRDINDPLAYPSTKRSVALNIIDLANLHTCSFIETKDLGTTFPEGSFEVKGRMDNSDIRGCNLMVG